MIEIILGDITKIKADAIVNAANPSLLGGGGVDGAIHSAAGPELLDACRRIPGNPRCPTGEARITPGFNLPSRYIIHTVGPVYRDGKHGEQELLRNAYISSLEIAYENKLRSIAFPAISAGVYGYPAVASAMIAVNTVRDFIASHSNAFDNVIFVLFSRDMYHIYEEIIDKSQ